MRRFLNIFLNAALFFSASKNGGNDLLIYPRTSIERTRNMILYLSSGFDILQENKLNNELLRYCSGSHKNN